MKTYNEKAVILITKFFPNLLTNLINILKEWKAYKTEKFILKQRVTNEKMAVIIRETNA